MPFDDHELFTPRSRFIGDVRLDEVRELGERCHVNMMFDGAESLLDRLNRGTEVVVDERDILLLAGRYDEPWARFVDPALSRCGAGRKRHVIVLYECFEHIVELKGRGRKWNLLFNGRVVNPSEIGHLDEVEEDEEIENAEVADDVYDDDDEGLTPAARRHLLARLSAAEDRVLRAEADAKRETTRLRKEIESIRQRLTQEMNDLKGTAARRISILEAERDDQDERIAGLLDQLEELRQQLKGNSDAKLVAEEAFNVLQSQSENLERSLSSANSRIADLETRNEALEEEIESVRELSSRAENDLSVSRLEVEKLTSARSALSVRVSDEQAQVRELRSRLEREVAKVLELNLQLNRERAQSSDFREQIRQLTNACAEAVGSARLAQSELTDLRAKLKNLPRRHLRRVLD